MSVSDKPSTLRAQMKHHEPIVCFAVKTKQVDMRTSEETAHPLDSNDDKEPQAVCYRETSNLTGGGAEHNCVCLAIEGNSVDRASGKNGRGWCENVSPTLNTQDRHAVCYAVDVWHLRIDGTVSGTLQAKNTGGHSLNYINPVIYEQDE